MNFHIRENRFSVFLFLMASLLFTLGSGRLPFLSSDEPRYSQVAREMLRSHEYIVPCLAGLPWYEKPVGLYWLMVGSFQLLGINEFSARLPSALAALATVVAVYATVKKLTDANRGLVSSLILATSAFFVVFSHAANFDMLLTCCVTFTICSFLLYESDQRTFFLYTMYLATGLGVLTKGFVALILPSLSIGAYLLITGKMKQMFRMKLLTGLLIVVAVSAIWFLPISLISGIQFWNVFFFEHHVARYASGFSHTEGFFFYYPVLLLGTYPWTLTPFLSINFSRTESEKNLTKLSLCWLFGTVLFFSFSKTQLPSYILPAVPPFGILGGLSLVNYFKKIPRHAGKIILVIGIMNAFALIAIIWVFRKFALPGGAMFTFIIPVEILTLISLFFVLKEKLVLALCAYSMIPFAGLLIFFYFIFPQIHWSESKMLSLAIMPRLTADRKLVQYDMGDYAPVFYTDGRVEILPDGHLYILNSPEQLYRYLSRKKEAYVLVDNEDLDWISRDNSWLVSNVIHGRELSVLDLILPPKRSIQP